MRTWDATETSERIRSREVSAREVIEGAISRAEAAGHLGAIVTETFDAALRTCDTAAGPFAGVPTFVKDLAHVRGVPMGWGTRAVRGVTSRQSEPAVRLLEQIGLVSLGKSATPEFGLTATTEPLERPPCRNPWDLSRSAGGSSGGAGALVASGVVPIAHGSDGGGSVRIPAACTGLVGLKPTRGRLDMEGSNLLPINVAVNGVLTRTVRDTVGFWSAVDAVRKPARPIGPVAPSPRVLRMGMFLDSPTGCAVSPEVRAVLEETAKLLEELGHRVEVVPCPASAGLADDWVRYWSLIAWLQDRLGRALVHRTFDRRRLEPWTSSLSSWCGETPREVFGAVRRLRAFSTERAQRLTAHDVLLSPVLAQIPPPLGHLATDVPFDVALERIRAFCPFTWLANATGTPAISLPLGRTAEGVPIGVHLIGGAFEEGMLLSLALQLEAARPWPRLAPTESTP